jgi:2-keto-4-pentenoate hydratase/2-oxohepta-3-ene-1,7-dioic acid hydratase in catechol pathway
MGETAYGEIADGRFHPFVGEPFDDPRRSGASHGLDEITLRSPVQPRTLFITLGGFLKEGASLPPGTQPRLTTKVTAEVLGDSAVIEVPRFVTKPLWMEIEVAVVIGRRVRDASLDEAREAILGYTVINDATAAEFMWDYEANKPLASADHMRSKSIDTFAALGPWIDTDLTEQEMAEGIKLVTRVNGEEKAWGNTRLAKFPPSYVVSWLSEAVALFPGDVIAMGTPQPALANPDDEIELEIEGIGTLRNTLVAR